MSAVHDAAVEDLPSVAGHPPVIPPLRRPPRLAWLPLAAMMALLAACGSAPRSGGGGMATSRPAPAPTSERDGPEANPPSDLASVPDAQPQLEPIRKGGPNKPYEAMGRGYVPIAEDRPFTERGLASWYGRKFHGRPTASGEPYDMYKMTAAHPTLPIPSYVRVRNPANQREVVVRVNDRGPFHSGRIIDLSYTAAYKLGLLKGVAPVEITRITSDEIRAGTWRKGWPSDGPEPASTALASATRPRVGELDGPAAPANSATAAVLPRVPAPAAIERKANGDAVARIAQATSAPSREPGEPVTSPLASSIQSPITPATGAGTPATGASAVASSAALPVQTRPAPGFWVQLGVFRQREGAEVFHRRVIADIDWLAPLLAVFGEPSGYRLQAGPYANRDEAQGVARRVRETLNLVPVVIDRR